MPDDLINFEALDLEEGNKSNEQAGTQKLASHMKFLKEKLSAEDYSAAMKSLGVKLEMSHEELLESLKQLLEKTKEEEEDEVNMESYKDFMEKCMKEGKSMKECSDSYKEKYPEAEPSEKEAADVAALAKEKEMAKKEDDEEYPAPDKKMQALENRIAELEKKLQQKDNTAQLTGEVEKLIQDKHIAPSQKDSLIKLAANLDLDEQKNMLSFFRTTQKLSLFTDAGVLESKTPGGHKPEDISPERRKELMETFGINDIIEDRGLKRRNN